MLSRLSILVCLGLLTSSLFSGPRGAAQGHGEAEWQWSAVVDSAFSTETNDHPRAFLWVPPDCQHVRGVVVGQHNMLEEGILEHPVFRKTLKRLGFAEIWVTPGLDLVFDFNKGAGERFNDMMKKLAVVSGYGELEFAPVIPMGHSAAASYPWNFAAWDPSRTLAILSIHGDAPLTNKTGSGRPNPDWGERNIDGVPGLMVMGEYEWLEERINPALNYLAAHPHAAISFLTDAGHGHFDFSDALVDYLALFIRKAAEARLPLMAPGQGQTRASLRPVDPTKGWVVDRWRKNEPLKAAAAAYPVYTGDRKESFWYFDKEIALATEAYYTRARGKMSQYIGFMQDGVVLKSTGGLARFTLPFVPLEDGISFRVKAFFADSSKTRPVEYERDHAGTPLVISRICGPVIKVNDTTFQIHFYRMGFNNPKRSNDIWMLASNAGDAMYKSAVQQLDVRFPLRNKDGKEQRIAFPAIPDQKEGAAAVPLGAVSDAGMPVHYYVKEGPAVLRGDTEVYLSRIPPKAKFPVKVTIVAWQYGRIAEPKLQTAEPVEQSFYIIKHP